MTMSKYLVAANHVGEGITVHMREGATSRQEPLDTTLKSGRVGRVFLLRLRETDVLGVIEMPQPSDVAVFSLSDDQFHRFCERVIEAAPDGEGSGRRRQEDPVVWGSRPVDDDSAGEAPNRERHPLALTRRRGSERR